MLVECPLAMPIDALVLVEPDLFRDTVAHSIIHTTFFGGQADCFPMVLGGQGVIRIPVLVSGIPDIGAKLYIK